MRGFLTVLSFYISLWLIDRPNLEWPLRWFVSVPPIKSVMIYDQNRIELSLQTIVDKPRQAGAFRQVSGVTTVLVISRDLNVVVQGILFQPNSLGFQCIALRFCVSSLIYPAINRSFHQTTSFMCRFSHQTSKKIFGFWQVAIFSLERKTARRISEALCYRIFNLLIEHPYPKVEIRSKCYPEEIRNLQPCGQFIHFPEGQNHQ